MTFSDKFENIEPAREDIDNLCGPAVLEFGTDWCGHCQAAQPLIRQAFASNPHIPHIKVEEGRPLGRSFGIKQGVKVLIVLIGTVLFNLLFIRRYSNGIK